MLTIYFYTTNTIYGRLIRKITGGEYNHVAIGVNGYVYEAVKEGVIKRKDNKEYTKAQYLVNVYGDDTLCQSWLEEQVGKGYDWLGVLSFIWIWLPNRIGYWFCSELATVALMKLLGIEEYNQKQSPQDLYYLTKLIN